MLSTQILPMSELTEISVQTVALLLEVAADFCFEPNIWSTGLVIIIISVVSLGLSATDDMWRGPSERERGEIRPGLTGFLPGVAGGAPAQVDVDLALGENIRALGVGPLRVSLLL